MTKRKQDLIENLNLIKHIEGGYFVETFRSEDSVYSNASHLTRDTLTSIFYMIESENPISYLIKNQSDLVLYYQEGDALDVILVDLEGNIYIETLGRDISNGQKMQINCPANFLKAYELKSGEYTLIGEAVAPGFEYEDMLMIKEEDLSYLESDKIEKLKPYLR
jgi:predicted cupin superfamily sugar epimerase